MGEYADGAHEYLEQAAHEAKKAVEAQYEEGKEQAQDYVVGEVRDMAKDAMPEMLPDQVKESILDAIETDFTEHGEKARQETAVQLKQGSVEKEDWLDVSSGFEKAWNLAKEGYDVGYVNLVEQTVENRYGAGVNEVLASVKGDSLILGMLETAWPGEPEDIGWIQEKQIKWNIAKDVADVGAHFFPELARVSAGMQEADPVLQQAFETGKNIEEIVDTGGEIGPAAAFWKFTEAVMPKDETQKRELVEKAADMLKQEAAGKDEGTEALLQQFAKGMEQNPDHFMKQMSSFGEMLLKE